MPSVRSQSYQQHIVAQSLQPTCMQALCSAICCRRVEQRNLPALDVHWSLKIRLNDGDRVAIYISVATGERQTEIFFLKLRPFGQHKICSHLRPPRGKIFAPLWPVVYLETPGDQLTWAEPQFDKAAIVAGLAHESSSRSRRSREGSSRRTSSTRSSSDASLVGEELHALEV